jgi:hypothetical protein
MDLTQSIRLLGWVISTVARPATYTGQHRQKKREHTSMPRVGFEPTTPVLERAKTFHALDCVATVTGNGKLKILI